MAGYGSGQGARNSPGMSGLVSSNRLGDGGFGGHRLGDSALASTPIRGFRCGAEASHVRRESGGYEEQLVGWQ